MTQPLSLREQLKALESIQELDLKIDSILQRKGALPQALSGLQDAYMKIQRDIEAKKKSVTEVEKIQRQTQAALEINKDRSDRSSSKLESVQNTQEYQAASKEIEQLKKLNDSLEEQIKKSNADLESFQADLVKLNEASDKARSELEEQRGQMDQQSGKFDADIAAIETDRVKHTELVEKRLLLQYNRIRGARGGLGLVPAMGGRCRGCNMMLPPQLFNEVHRANAIHQCPSCHRILYVPGESDSASSPKGQDKNL